ncbi:hypothetical protein WISP_79009 [Willisornis vidua]|uniref:Uncharacterized protein n=1 Tax=Willisornis vidua TaxID=1566151 RepID=A0ABQ9DB89_9PASS|nr:hypothetical protein WISP_79009 [Willisornis vidua]
MNRSLQSGLHMRTGTGCQMAEKGSTEGNTCSPSASTSQMPQAAPPNDPENPMCPICMDAFKDQVSGTTSALPGPDEKGELVNALQRGGIIPEAASSAALPAETVTLAVPVPETGNEGGPRGGNTVATAGVSRPRAMTPQAAAVSRLKTHLVTLLVMRTKLQGLNRMPQFACGAASGISGDDMFLPESPGQHGADPRGGCAVLMVTEAGSTPY